MKFIFFYEKLLLFYIRDFYYKNKINHEFRLYLFCIIDKEKTYHLLNMIIMKI